MNEGKPVNRRYLRRRGVKTSGRQELQDLTTLLKNGVQEEAKEKRRN
jgi:hypothetical protein